MTKIRTGVLSPTAAVIFLLSALAVPASGTAAPYLPIDDAQVLERLPAPGDAEMRELRRLRKDLARDPGNLTLALGLARRYFARARAEADPRYNGYAEAVLAPWWDLPEPPVEVLVLRANLRQNRHRFDAAVADLDRALKREPRHAQAMLTRAFVLMVQGEYTAARRGCRGLPASVGGLVAATCLSRVNSLSGYASEAYERLDGALRSDPAARPELRLWALTNLAEIAVLLGRPEAAERHFREALAPGLRSAYLLGAYGDLLLEQGRFEEVRSLLADESRIDALLLRRAIAEKRLGGAEAEALEADLEARFEASRRRGDARHRREEARFRLDFGGEPLEALRLAKQNWTAQREPWDVRLVLEAALAAERPEAAAEVAEWIRAKGFEDAAIQPLLAQIEENDR